MPRMKCFAVTSHVPRRSTEWWLAEAYTLGRATCTHCGQAAGFVGRYWATPQGNALVQSCWACGEATYHLTQSGGGSGVLVHCRCHKGVV